MNILEIINFKQIERSGNVQDVSKNYLKVGTLDTIQPFCLT